MSNWAPLFGCKTESQTKSEDDTIAEDDDLKVTLGANEKWVIRVVVYISTTGNADFQCDFDGPAAECLHIDIHFADHNLITGDYSVWKDAYEDAFAVNFTSGDINTDLRCDISIEVGDAAGDFVFRWAQGNSHADETSVKKGSFIKANRVG